jgi:tRNA pseudouridine55 synthase
MLTGVVLLDKPSGRSSANALGVLKRTLGAEKAGHAGTLDPMATGLLVCLFGKATRLASFAESGRKIYSGTMRFGMTTSTDDIEGEILSQNAALPGLDAIRAELKHFTGEISQVPPNISAVKIGGERAYDLARRGEQVEIAARMVTVYSFEVLRLAGADAQFRVECTPGTYIRSLARDLGERLGCGGCLSGLRREFSAPFDVADARTLDSASVKDVLPWTRLFPDTERVELSKDAALRLLRGDERTLGELRGPDSGAPGSRPIIYGTRDTACGLLVPTPKGWGIGANVLTEQELGGF